MNIFDYADFFIFLNTWLKNHKARGLHQKFAIAAQCSPSWMTRVLKGGVLPTPDQVFGIAQVMNLTEIETDYLLTLVDLARATTPQYKKNLKQKLERMSKSARKLSEQINADKVSLGKTNDLYYSSWIYAAIHVACMTGEKTVSELALSLRLQEQVVQQRLQELKEMNLVTNSGLRWKSTKNNIHLDAESSMAKIGHINWRQHTVHHLSCGIKDGLHYSAIHALSKKNFDVVHDLLRSSIVNCRKVIDEKPNETISVFSVDWYQI